MRPILSMLAETHEAGIVVVEHPRNSRFDLDMRIYVPKRRLLTTNPIMTWQIDRKYLGTLRVLLAEHFGEIYDRTGIGEMEPHEGFADLWKRRKGGPWAQPEPKKSPYSMLHLLDTAPLPVVEAAYRALAKMYHGDIGGNDAMMAEINLAVEAIRRTLAPVGGGTEENDEA